MKILLCALILLSGCTSINYTGKEGRVFNYWSSKDQVFKIKKTWDGYEIDVNAQNEGKEVIESIAKGVVKGVLK
jgi:hypothetical protein